MSSPMSQTLRTTFIGDFGSMNRGLNDVNGRFRTVASSMKAMAATGVAVAAISFFKNAIDEAREAEKVTRQTQAVLQSTGGVANVTAGQITGLADKLSKMAGVDDEVIQSGENMLLTFTKVRNEAGAGNDVFNQATEIALDMSAAMGIDLNAAVIKVGKALNNPISGLTALSKVGVQFTDQQKEQIKALANSGDMLGAQQAILRELRTEFGGMAAASADSMDKMGVAWGNFAEDVGKKVMPAVTAVSSWALNTGIPALGRVADTVGNVVEPAFDGMVAAGKGVVSMWQSLSAPIQNGILALGAWALVGSRVTDFFSRSTGPMRKFGEEVTMVKNASQGAVGSFGASMQVLQDRIPALGAAGAAFRKAKGDAIGFGSTLKGIGAGAMSGFKAAAGGLMGMLGGPWGLAIAGGVTLLSAFSSMSAKAEAEQKKLEDAGKMVADAIAEQNGEINRNTREKAAQAAEDAGLLQGAERFGISTTMVTDALLGQNNALSSMKAQLMAVADAHSHVESSEGGAVVIYDQEGNAALGLAEKLDEVTGAKDSNVASSARVAKATETTTEAQKTALTATELFANAIEGAGIEFDESASLADQLRQAIDQLTAAEMQQVDTLESYEAAQDALTASVQQNGRTLNIHTEAGRRNRDALEDVAKKSRDLMQADIDSGVPMNQALKRHNDRIAALKTEAVKTFGAKSEAVKLINTYSKVPKAVTTAIRQKGYEDVNRKMMDLSSKQFLLAQGMAITPSNLRAVQKEKNQQRSGGFASGGLLRGPGTSTSDSIPLWGSSGEYMQQASAVNYYGQNVMEAMNHRMIPKQMFQGLAGGGMVWPFKVLLSKTKIPDMYAAAIAAAGRVGGGAGVQRWAGIVIQALKLLHQPASLLGSVLRRMNQESGGNQYAINNWDSNAARGTPSMGLMQTIGPTFSAYAGPFRGRGVYDPLANIYAGLNYALHRYGSIRAAMDKPGGYKNGGILGPGQFGYNETRKPEMVLNQDQWNSMSSGQKHYHLHLNVTNHPVDVVQQFARMELLA